MVIKIGKTEENVNITYRFWFRSILYNIYPLFFYSNFLGWYNIPWEANFVFVKTTLLDVGKNAIFCQFFKNPSNGINVNLAWVFSLDDNIIKVKNDKNIEFFSQNLVNIALEAGPCIGEPKRHYLLFEMAISSLKSRFPFIALFYPHSMVSTHKVKLSKLFYLN